MVSILLVCVPVADASKYMMSEKTFLSFVYLSFRWIVLMNTVVVKSLKQFTHVNDINRVKGKS